jgi:hypothetical protein
MADRSPIPIPLPRGADQLLDLMLKQLPEHTEPDLDRKREQPLLRSPDQLPHRLLHALREHASSLIASATGTLHFTGSSFDHVRIAHHAPTGSGRAGGTAVTSKCYEPRDNLSTTASWTEGRRRGHVSDRGWSAGIDRCGERCRLLEANHEPDVVSLGFRVLSQGEVCSGSIGTTASTRRAACSRSVTRWPSPEQPKSRRDRPSV